MRKLLLKLLLQLELLELLRSPSDSTSPICALNELLGILVHSFVTIVSPERSAIIFNNTSCAAALLRR